MANVTFTMESGINDSIYGKSQGPIKMFIEKKAEAFEQKSLLPSMFAMETSQNFGEKFTSMTAMDGFQPVGENGSTPIDGMQEGFSKFVEQMTWKNSFSISREMAEDSKLLDLNTKPNQFTTSYYRTRELFGNALYAGAITGKSKVDFRGKSFDVTGADGMTLFNTAHKSIIKSNKTTQSNCFSDAFSVDALSAVSTEMQGFEGDNGELLTITPNTIMIPNDYALKKAVFAAIGADKDPDTANNGYNYQFGMWNVIVNPYLNKLITSGTQPWILLDSEYMKENRSAVILDRTALDIDSYVDKNTHANVWSGFARYTGVFVDWRYIAVGGVSTGDTLISSGT